MNAEEIWKSCEIRVSYLFSRWQDEKEYEDFNEYVKVMKQLIEELGGKFIKGYKRPFGFSYELNGQKFQITINKKNYSYRNL